MARELKPDMIRVRLGFDIDQYSTPSTICPFIFDSNTPTKIKGATRYMVVVDVLMHESVAPDSTFKDVALVAEYVEQ